MNAGSTRATIKWQTKRPKKTFLQRRACLIFMIAPSSLVRATRRALVSGTIAAAAVTLVASLAARRAAGSSAAALNATSHFLWGERAGRENAYSNIVPKRLTPGFELRLPPAALACVYAALALGLCARDLVATRRSTATKPGPGKQTARTMRRYPCDPIKQAASDRSRGLENTDCRVLDQSSQEHCPRPAPGKKS